MSSVDKLKALLNKEYKTYKEFHEDNEKDAWMDEQAQEYLGSFPPSKVSPKNEKHLYSNRHSYEDALSLKAIDKLKSLLNEKHKKHKKPRMTYPKIGDNVWDSRQNKWVIEDKQGESTNILEYKKAIDKLKALLSKDGETNGGEKSQKTEDQKKESPEGKTAENYDNREYGEKKTPMYPTIIREFPPDAEDRDPYN